MAKRTVLMERSKLIRACLDEHLDTTVQKYLRKQGTCANEQSPNERMERE